MNKYLAAIMMAITLVSCEPTETPNLPEFSIRIEADFLEENEPAWIFLHDTEGNALDFKPFSNNESLEFEIDSKEQWIHVTVVKKQEAGSFERYNVETISSINPQNEFNSDMNYNNWSGNWRLRDTAGNLTVIWNVWGKSSGFKLKAFPLEFTIDHPEFSNLDLFKLFSMKLMQSHKEYDQLVESKFVELNNIEQTQEYYLTKRF